MTEPADHRARARFVSELDRNFSVVASAGSGKTRAITDRIIQIALSENALEWLPRLVVVTFTNRAADEMQQRARQKILEAGVSLEILSAFNRAFFGTIHSFCVKLLANHGHHLGLPAKFDLITDDEDLWNEFVQQQTVVGESLSKTQRELLLRHVEVRRLMELGRRGGLSFSDAPLSELPPQIDLKKLFEFVPKGPAKKTIPALQAQLEEWKNSWLGDADFLPLPACTSKASEFANLWRDAFDPFCRWLRQASLTVAAGVERAYREFRLSKGALTYGDQVALARELLCQPDAARRIREKQYRVVLDEAQDTDPQQFSMLLEIARPPDAAGEWLEAKSHPPGPGHFCMVGDFQQSIYGDRADLARYRRIHEALVQTGAGEELKFSVTFRLDRQHVDFVNETFRNILNNLEGQVQFVELSPRPEVLPGQIVRLDLNAATLRPDANGKITERQKVEFESRELAAWLRRTGLEKLRARAWRDVAILCPRKGWFRPLRAALRSAGIDAQIQSERDVKGDSPAYAWFTALAMIMSEPTLSYEIVGVLREVFGISDHDLAVFSEGHGDRFQIARQTSRSDAVSQSLNLLSQTRAAIQGLPLFTAMQEMVKSVRLRERLRTLPAEEYAGLETELDSLLTLAASAEAEAKTSSAFAENLRANFDAIREVQAAEKEAIQLITCQKAKGSEWQAVIVPFLSRRIHTRSAGYPRLIRHQEEFFVALQKEDITPELKETVERSDRQEMERLLYVALTRARHTLVLACDHDLFANAKGEIPKSSQARFFQCHGSEANFRAVQKLPIAPAACSTTNTRQKNELSRQAAEQKVQPLPQFDPDALEAASNRASNFLRKKNPSGLAETMSSVIDADVIRELDPEFRPPAPFDNPATRYGIWWHEFAERIKWAAGAESWDQHFANWRAHSPEVARSQTEWELLRRHLQSNSGLAARLTGPGLIVHSEMPFLWRMDENSCLEGIVDLAIFDPLARRWLIVDWKTNRVPRGDAAAIREQYKSQLAAYARAFGSMLGLPVDAAIYSTGSGEWLPYEASDLAQEWTRLLQTSPPVSLRQKKMP